MRTRLTLLPGPPGTKELTARYGAQLICVRYRYDAQKRKRYKTVERIVEERDWQPPEAEPAAAEVVAIRVGIEETALRQQVKPAGGGWNAQRKVWEVPYEQVVRLGLRDRLVAEEVI